MSQQKVFFTVCAVVALATVVSGQGIKPADCIAAYRSLFREYISSFQKNAQAYSQSMIESGNSAFDVEGFNKDVQDLVSQYTSFTDMSNGVNVQQFTTNGMKIARSQISLALKYFMNPALALSASETTANLSSKIMSENIKLARQLASACSITA